MLRKQGKNNEKKSKINKSYVFCSHGKVPRIFLIFCVRPEEEDLLVLTKHAELMPQSAHAVAMAALVQTVVTALTSLEILHHLVGSYNNGTMLRGDIVADIVAIFDGRGYF